MFLAYIFRHSDRSDYSVITKKFGPWPKTSQEHKAATWQVQWFVCWSGEPGPVSGESMASCARHGWQHNWRSLIRITSTSAYLFITEPSSIKLKTVMLITVNDFHGNRYSSAAEFKQIFKAVSVSTHTITTFTCQATVRQNETARSDVIEPFGLHVCWSHSRVADASVNIHCAG